MATHSFPVPHPLDVNMSMIFSLKNVKQGHKLKLMCVFACWIMHMKCCWQISKWNAKGGQITFKIGRGLEPSVLP